MTLTAKQQAFIREYLVDFNATQACIRAGYSVRTANEQGAQNLAKLSSEIKLYQDKIAANAEITQQDIINRLALIAFDKIGDDVLHKDQIKALELIGKHIGMFTTSKIELTGKDGSAIAITNIDAVDVASRLLSDASPGREESTAE
jgi:phage terminase small subunit